MTRGLRLFSMAVFVAALSGLGHAEAKGASTCFGRVATIVGTNKADRLIGTPHADVIVGRGGEDIVRGGGGSDFICAFQPKRLDGGPGNDRLLERGARDTGHVSELSGGPGNDLLIGRSPARLSGGEGNDRLRTRGGAAVPGPGKDIVRGLPSRYTNSLSYAGALHYVVVDLKAGTAWGQGLDRLAGIDDLFGSRFDDDLRGNKRDNYIDGWRGDDAMYGRGGNDVLLGYSGHDFGSGGPGLDSCDFEVEVTISCTTVTD